MQCRVICRNEEGNNLCRSLKSSTLIKYFHGMNWNGWKPFDPNAIYYPVLINYEFWNMQDQAFQMGKKLGSLLKCIQLHWVIYGFLLQSKYLSVLLRWAENPNGSLISSHLPDSVYSNRLFKRNSDKSASVSV